MISIIKKPQLGIKQLNISYSGNELENISGYQSGNVVAISFEIKAGVLSAGYNKITISTASWYVTPACTFISQDTADDGKVFGANITNSALHIRASASNANNLTVHIVGLAV